MHANPYGEDLGNRDPLEALGETPIRIRTIVERWGDDHFERSYAPGKWSGAQIVLHLAQDEVGWSNRVRMALSGSEYVVQPFDAAAWVERETPVDALAALEAYLALRKLNLGLYRGVGEEERSRPFRHPEVGEMSVDWILRTLAGHDLHHLKQLEKVRP